MTMVYGKTYIRYGLRDLRRGDDYVASFRTLSTAKRAGDRHIIKYGWGGPGIEIVQYFIEGAPRAKVVLQYDPGRDWHEPDDLLRRD